ncbi:MAG: hypothetical protein A2Z34_07030 [Planctomycetes bacterium RBG_16_59_8]|nr:MAG: hypothetical protein A2Z34_07030 [Planctomycetes bacterium RBG_16_59_8]
MGRVRRKKRFECSHYGFGKYCHACKDAKAGKSTPKKKKIEEQQAQEKRYWQRAKCPYCNGTRVKKNEINAMSPIDVKEFTCASWECGKSFNIDMVKEFEKVEVRPRVSRFDTPEKSPEAEGGSAEPAAPAESAN